MSNKCLFPARGLQGMENEGTLLLQFYQREINKYTWG